MIVGTKVGINDPESRYHGKIGKVSRNFDSGWYHVKLESGEEIGAYGSDLKVIENVKFNHGENNEQ